jgi:hypothetical protein
MAAKKRPWTVTDHTLKKLEDNLWIVEGMVPGVPIHRRMSIIKMADGALLFYHAIPLTDAELAEVSAWGRPAYLVVAHHQHCIDANAFAEKLGLKVFAPQACERQVRERVALSGTLDTFPNDDTVSVEAVPGSKFGEAMVKVKSGAHVNLLFADVIQNNPTGETKLLFRLLGFAGGPKVVPAYRMLFINDRPAVKAYIEECASLPALSRVIPFHGTIVEQNAGHSLRAAVASL